MLKFPVSLLTRTNVGEFLDKIVFRINYKWEEVICILLFIRCGRVKFSLGCRVAIVRFCCRLSWRYIREAVVVPFRVFDDWMWRQEDTDDATSAHTCLLLAKQLAKTTCHLTACWFFDALQNHIVLSSCGCLSLCICVGVVKVSEHFRETPDVLKWYTLLYINIT